jgi:hypothetical protein
MHLAHQETGLSDHGLTAAKRRHTLCKQSARPRVIGVVLRSPSSIRSPDSRRTIPDDHEDMTEGPGISQRSRGGDWRTTRPAEIVDGVPCADQ